MAAIIALSPWLSEISKNYKADPLLKENATVDILYKQQRLEAFDASQHIKFYILKTEGFNRFREFIY